MSGIGVFHPRSAGQDHSDKINPASLLPTHHCYPPHLRLLDPLWVSARRSLHHGKLSREGRVTGVHRGEAAPLLIAALVTSGAQPTRGPHQRHSPLAFLEVFPGAGQEPSAPADLREFTPPLGTLRPICYQRELLVAAVCADRLREHSRLWKGKRALRTEGPKKVFCLEDWLGLGR